MDTQRLPRLRRLLRKLSAISCRVLDRICTRLYLTQIARRSANGYRAMQLCILTRQGGVNACALARWTHSVFHPAIFCFLLEILIHFIFRLHPKYTKSQRSKPPPRFPGAGVLLFAKRAPFAQFTKMSAKDGWAMLLWAHSAFRTFGVSC